MTQHFDVLGHDVPRFARLTFAKGLDQPLVHGKTDSAGVRADEPLDPVVEDEKNRFADDTEQRVASPAEDLTVEMEAGVEMFMSGLLPIYML